MRPAAFAVLLPALCFAQQAQPRLVLDALEHDFGVVERDSRTTHRFRISNGGDAPLRILQVRPSCGCTSTVMGREILAPGEGTDLDVTFNAAGLRGKSLKSIEVLSDDPREPSRSLILRADVAEDIRVHPEGVFFQDLMPRDRRRAVVKLESATGKPIHVVDVEMSPASWLGVATREKGNDVYLDLDLAAHALPEDKLTGVDTVTLHVMNPRDSAIRLQVKWEKRLPVYATPARVALSGAAGQERVARVTLKNRNRRPFRVLSAETTSSFLEVLDLPGGPGSPLTFRVKWSGKAPAGTYDERVILKLDDPTQPALEIRVAALLK